MNRSVWKLSGGTNVPVLSVCIPPATSGSGLEIPSVSADKSSQTVDDVLGDAHQWFDKQIRTGGQDGHADQVKEDAVADHVAHF
jgi:hypothetical protein